MYIYLYFALYCLSHFRRLWFIYFWQFGGIINNFLVTLINQSDSYPFYMTLSYVVLEFFVIGQAPHPIKIIWSSTCTIIIGLSTTAMHVMQLWFNYFSQVNYFDFDNLGHIRFYFIFLIHRNPFNFTLSRQVVLGLLTCF
jgi:hypothetical protein